MTEPHDSGRADGVEMPRPTVWPMVLGLGVTLLVAGWATEPALSLVGLVFFLFGLCGWIAQMLPGQGHFHEALVEPQQRPAPVVGAPGTVEQLRPGMAGYRFRLPENVRPISAGLKGGVVGGLVMPIPALLYGLVSGNGIWFPVNLLAGLVVPGVGDLTVEKLREFDLTYLVVGIVIHVCISLIVGLMYGVLLPTLPERAGGPVVWGGLLMPLFWTALSYGFMGIINPPLEKYVEWPWYLLSQLVFGIAASIVVTLTEKVHVQPAGSGTVPPADSRPVPPPGSISVRPGPQGGHP